MQPFSITLFATSGDPEGIRHLDKSNWSGYGVVFNKELFHLLKQEPGFSQAGMKRRTDLFAWGICQVSTDVGYGHVTASDGSTRSSQ
jgi:hypothetical protein